MVANLVNAERLTKSYGTRILLDDVSLGIASGETIGIVGRNGDGKTTLLSLLTGQIAPDSGKVTHSSTLNLGILPQVDHADESLTIRDIICNSQPDHTWASDSYARSIVQRFLADLDIDAPSTMLSGGQLRRAHLVRLLINPFDLIVLDEPTNHLDVEAVSYLAEALGDLQRRKISILTVSHDRWFLDAICHQIWEVHDGTVDSYEGGYAAYTLAKAERARIAAANEARRQNLIRKELAWLRRGAPARTSKPKFRIEAANALIADIPDLRDSVELQRFSMTRLGKDVIDMMNLSFSYPQCSPLFHHVDWSIGPGDRIGLIGVNGSGKSTLFKLFTSDLSPTEGKIKIGTSVRMAYLSQYVDELDEDDRVLSSVNRLKQATRLATGREASAASLLEDFGFKGDLLVTQIKDLSGGERRRLQLLRLLMEEPNVLLLDEPTNDLDIEMLQVLEDYLDSWPGTLIVSSHDRYFLERVTDVQYAITDDGHWSLLPQGIDQYLDHRRQQRRDESLSPSTESKRPSDAAALRQIKKLLAKLENQIAKYDQRIAILHADMAESATDYERLNDLHSQLTDLTAQRDEAEEQWLSLAESYDF